MKRDFSLQHGQRLVIAGKQNIDFLNIIDIKYITNEGGATTIFTKDGQVNTTKQLKEFESELKSIGFSRINRYTLVNLYHIKSYSSGDKRELELIDGSLFNVSRRKSSFYK